MKNVLFNIKSVITGSSNAITGAGAGSGAGTFFKVGAGAEKNSFGSTTLHILVYINPTGGSHSGLNLSRQRFIFWLRSVSSEVHSLARSTTSEVYILTLSVPSELIFWP
jgi:hypothetical protein